MLCCLFLHPAAGCRSNIVQVVYCCVRGGQDSVSEAVGGEKGGHYMHIEILKSTQSFLVFISMPVLYVCTFSLGFFVTN